MPAGIYHPKISILADSKIKIRAGDYKPGNAGSRIFQAYFIDQISFFVKTINNFLTGISHKNIISFNRNAGNYSICSGGFPFGKLFTCVIPDFDMILHSKKKIPIFSYRNALSSVHQF